MNQLGVFHYVPIAVDRQHCPVPCLVVKDQPAERRLSRLVWVMRQGGLPRLLRRQPAVMLHYPCVGPPLGLQVVEILSFAPCHGVRVERSPRGAAPQMGDPSAQTREERNLARAVFATGPSRLACWPVLQDDDALSLALRPRRGSTRWSRAAAVVLLHPGAVRLCDLVSTQANARPFAQATISGVFQNTPPPRSGRGKLLGVKGSSGRPRTGARPNPSRPSPPSQPATDARLLHRPIASDGPDERRLLSLPPPHRSDVGDPAQLPDVNCAAPGRALARRARRPWQGQATLRAGPPCHCRLR